MKDVKDTDLVQMSQVSTAIEKEEVQLHGSIATRTFHTGEISTIGRDRLKVKKTENVIR